MALLKKAAPSCLQMMLRKVMMPPLDSFGVINLYASEFTLDRNGIRCIFS